MSYIEGVNRNQSALLPPSLDEFVARDSIVRVIDAFVEGLDLGELGFTRAIPAQTGRPAYDPRILLKCYIYGYLNRIRSSRRLALECKRNVEMMFLTDMLTPDFRTIADFRKSNPIALKAVFSAFVHICSDLGLYSSGVLAIDGTKVRAQNARAHAYNKECLDKKLANIDRRIEEYLDMLDEADCDEDEDNTQDVDPDAVRRAIEDLKARKDTYKGYLQKIVDEGVSQVLTTDPEARRMHTKDGFTCCYNVHAAVDTATHAIAGFTINSSSSDHGNLKSCADEARELTDQKIVTVIADKGYESHRDIEKCLFDGIAPHVALKYNKRARIFNLRYREQEISKDILNSTDSKDIKTCLSAGVLPACYEDRGIQIEVQTRDSLSCFVRHEDNTVTCPQNKTLTLVKHRASRNTDIFKSRDACRECMNRCNDSDLAKEVSFGPNTTVVPVMVYGSYTHPPQEIPADAQISSFNHGLDRKDFAEKKVRIMIPHDKEQYQLRMNTVEHPFGTVKWYDGAHYLLMRGKEKVRAEIALSFLAYNLRRALNIVGFERLIAAVR